MKNLVYIIGFGVLLFGFNGCSSAPKTEPVTAKITEPVYEEVSFDDLFNLVNNGKLGYYIVNAYIDKGPFGFDGYGIFLHNSPEYATFLANNQNGRLGVRDKYNKIYVSVVSYFEERGISSSQIDESVIYRIHIYNNRLTSYSMDRPVTNIEGLMTIEEATAKKTESEAEKKRILEKTFILFPSSFDPSIYKKIDLFTAVAEMEKASRGDGSGLWELFNTRLYFSDVTFVAQDGTNITFSTDDGAITQLMKISSRSGLSVKQKVRIYYSALKNPLTEFNVVAIERR